eukprot:CAMPEP_0119118504 /NCGR_PEP_ID=MMETSP1310-20130426/360_1 /TAXON_ID=464262 /ORGANISM="Genus nov. species nov., Strain RCC2339" /LENGTH=382 /DNA_ID=CAMNT_0007107875 /DNA_START=96 /DNA_END=1244 /DNA_ORIENTATION=-
MGRHGRRVLSQSTAVAAEASKLVPGENGVIHYTTPEVVTHLCEAPSREIETTKEQLMEMYHQMYTIRRMETLCDSLYKQRLIKGFLHLYSGQEAVAVGIEHAITPEDAAISAYRCHGFQYVRGDSVESIIAEVCGKVTGCSKGKGGSMHMYRPNFLGGNGIVGAHVPVGTGVAFAQKYNQTKNVTVCAYGDGAANQGQLFEAFNMAALWKLPVVYVVENNMYAMGTSTERSYAGNVYYTRGDYVPGLLVDGMDILAVKRSMDFAVQNARDGMGPTIIEMKTYRYSGHSLSDPGTSYRTRDEVKAMRDSSDPIQGLKAKILHAEIATEDEFKAIEKEVRGVVQAAEKSAREAPDPGPEDLWTHILKEDTYARGVELQNSHYPE